MRTIKFRGKRLDTGDWVYGDLTTQFLSPRFSSDTCIFDGSWHCIDPSTVGQYTGLKDSNGVEIYEGDIIRGEYATYDGTHELLYEVKWFDNKGQRYVGFSFCDLNDAAMNLDTPKVRWVCNEMEVVGNIHDDSELLKGGVQ